MKKLGVLWENKKAMSAVSGMTFPLEGYKSQASPEGKSCEWSPEKKSVDCPLHKYIGEAAMAKGE